MDKQESKQTKDTEQMILEAAITEFSTKGFDGARTSTIAASAGVTHAMLHYYFRTKEKLFERIFKDKIRYIINMVISPMVESGGSIKHRIRTGIEKHFDFLLANKELPVFFITTFNSRPEVYQEIIGEFSTIANSRLTELQKELDKAHKNGEIGEVRADQLIGDIASLNVFPFLAYPMLMAATGHSDYNTYMELRKKEIVEIIMKRIS